MSVSRIDHLPTHILPRKTIVINQSLATLGSGTFSFSLLSLLNFAPTQMKIKQFVYANIAGTNNGSYLLYSDLTNDYIACAYVGAVQAQPSFPDTVINIPNIRNQINFRLDPANNANGVPTGQLTLVLEFC